ncbi:hypothetical protein J2S30_004416 [Herbaspirillum rubrisubalbicans]|nr:hypothetical protein [Herbaspirillum rubrisubalbicans]
MNEKYHNNSIIRDKSAEPVSLIYFYAHPPC